MEVIYSDESLNDIKFWKKSGNKSIQSKITQFILSIQDKPIRRRRETGSVKV